MSSTTDPADPKTPPDNPSARATHQRGRELFNRAKRCLERSDHDYAHDLLSQCVTEDPGSLEFLQHFRANLAQMHPNAAAAKKSNFSGLPGFKGSGRSAVAKAAAKRDWQEAFAAGFGALKKSPGDTGVLAEIAACCGALGHTNSQLYWLRWALDLSPTDQDLNRLTAAALESLGEYDQAIGCWLRIKQQKPDDEEAARAISRLSVEKTIDRGGYNPQLLSAGADYATIEPPRVAHASARHERAEAGDESSADVPIPAPPVTVATEEELRAALDATPDDPAAYATLADHYVAAGRLQDAERLLRKALEVGDKSDLVLLERLEEVYLARMRERAAAARQRAVRQGSTSGLKQSEQAAFEANQAEVEVFAARAQRVPEDAAVQFEYGLRLKRIGEHRDAVPPLQAARADKKRLAEIELHLGECFQHIDQHALAMRSYEASIAACPADEWTELRKLALYRAGVLAMGLRDLDGAERHLADLASADFAYRDVAERLDKLARIRKTH